LKKEVATKIPCLFAMYRPSGLNQTEQGKNAKAVTLEDPLRSVHIMTFPSSEQVAMQ